MTYEELKDLQYAQLNEMLASLLGWQKKWSDAKMEYRWHASDGISYHYPPDYARDLNFCLEAEESLTESEHHLFRNFLWDITDPSPNEDWSGEKHSRAYVSAKPRQRTIALILARQQDPAA